MNNCIKNNKPNNYKLIITKTLEEKIRLMCSKSWDTEWSGILFYKVEGDFSSDDLKITCLDCKILDIGTLGATEFEIDESVCAYMTHNNLCDCYMGLIHSHNNLATFFSKTDLDTLASEGQDTNNFVSLIVNNKGEYTAAITRKVKIKEHEKNISYTLFDKQINQSIVTEEKEIIEYTEVKVLISRTEQVYNSIMEDIAEIKKTKEREKLLKTLNQEEKDVINWSYLNQFLFDGNRQVNNITSLQKTLEEEMQNDNEDVYFDSLVRKSALLDYSSLQNLKRDIIKISKYTDIPFLNDLLLL
jgi:proteasome lid subunit RPN8/RPN11